MISIIEFFLIKSCYSIQERQLWSAALFAPQREARIRHGVCRHSFSLVLQRRWQNRPLSHCQCRSRSAGRRSRTRPERGQMWQSKGS